MFNDAHLTRRSALRLAGAGALAAVALPVGVQRGFAQDASPVPVDGLVSLGLPELNLTVSDTEFTGLPAELSAGMYLVHLSSSGSQPAFATFMQLPEGMTSAADFMQALGGMSAGGNATAVSDAEAGNEAGSEGPPEWFYQVYMPGGAGAVPGMTAHFVVDLRPGTYILWGEDPSATQQPVDLTVTGDSASPMPTVMPRADVTIVEVGTDSGYAFQLEGGFASGSQVVAIRNDSDQPHFVEIDMLPAGTTKGDVDALLQSFMTGTPSAGNLTEDQVQPVYFAGTQSAGTTQWHEVPVMPGTYLLTCWISDPTRGGIPHAMEGMYDVITVS